MTQTASLALIRGDGIGIDVANAAMAVADAACARCGCALRVTDIAAGAGYFRDTGRDIEPGGEDRAGTHDAIFLGAIGLPSVRHTDGTEISPHLRLRDQYGLYAGVRPV
ncbi:MAG: isocitrate/isopropylmalate family dehydrogenase, partial [Primorskyibacter sp.]